MKDDIQGIQKTVDNAVETMNRISALCDMLGGLGDSKSIIPVESLCYTMFLIRDMLTEQAGTLEEILLPLGRMVAA